VRRSAAPLPPIDAARLGERLATLVRTDSQNPPGREAEAGALVAGWCEDLGFEVTTHEAEPNRPNVVARRRFGAGPVVAFCSHIDTVPVGDPSAWERDPLAAEVVDGVMWGRGACDAKGSVAAAFTAAETIVGDPPATGTLELHLVSDEETMGFKGAGFLLEERVVAPERVVVGEPTSLRLVIAQRGACWMELTTRGVAAHGSAPERGRNAIVQMAEIVAHLDATLPDVGHPLLGGPSINVGTIVGGSKVNMVAASCTIEIDRRTVPGEDREGVLSSVRAAIEAARARYPDIDASARIAFFGRPFEIDRDARVVHVLGDAVAEVNARPPELMGFRGASDARFYAEAGAEVVVCGPGDIALAHTARESVALAEVESAARTFALAFGRLLQP
jgi:acetylornithine deacetylase/succinyl-diaminopimelate desuccinylase